MEHTPNYYTVPGIGDVSTIIDALGMGHDFRIGNILKYVIRAGRKTKDPLLDLKKARSYLDEEIRVQEKASQKKHENESQKTVHAWEAKICFGIDDVVRIISRKPMNKVFKGDYQLLYFPMGGATNVRVTYPNAISDASIEELSTINIFLIDDGNIKIVGKRNVVIKDCLINE